MGPEVVPAPVATFSLFPSRNLVLAALVSTQVFQMQPSRG